MFLNASDVHFHSVEQLLAEQIFCLFVFLLIHFMTKNGYCACASHYFLIEILGAHPSGMILMVVVVDNQVSLVFSF